MYRLLWCPIQNFYLVYALWGYGTPTSWYNTSHPSNTVCLIYYIEQFCRTCVCVDKNLNCRWIMCAYGPNYVAHHTSPSRPLMNFGTKNAGGLPATIELRAPNAEQNHPRRTPFPVPLNPSRRIWQYVSLSRPIPLSPPILGPHLTLAHLYTFQPTNVRWGRAEKAQKPSIY